ncbi:MAG: alpha-amylase family glycosyl hydrolase [Anaerolineales bacterium]|nr:alpha-amylase family glycosyl hydrolase [Anaerolineales bacterium]
MNGKNPWWQTGVIYQIYPRSFQDTTGSGVGDLPGIIQRLPYLSETLGVDALWLSPFYPSPMKDFGYDVSDYRDVHPLFGTLEDFDRLLREAHERGLKIIIDLVPNHSSDQHPWFQESRSSRENDRRDWYIWADPGPDGAPPNNWLSVFGGSAWEWDENTGQYYLHSFLKEQPDLNWRNPRVKEAMFDVARFWLDRGVDGFRIDVAHYIMKDPDLRDNPLNPDLSPSIHRPLGEYDSHFHLYDKGHPDNHQVYREFREILDEYSQEKPRIAIGEIHIMDWEEWASYYGENLDEIHLPYNFSLLAVEWQADQVQAKVDQLESVLPPGAWPNYVLGNHDEQRLASRIGEDQARNAALLLLTLRGTPTIYYGDEIGMKDVPIPPDQQLDPAGLRQPDHGQSRDSCRTPMQWSPGPRAGFSPPGAETPWLPLPDDYTQTNVETQLADPRSLLALYRRLLELRKTHPVLQTGAYRPLKNPPPDCFCYWRENESQQMLICLNFSGQPRTLAVPSLEGANLILSTHLDRSGPVPAAYTLRPHEGCLFSL